MTGQNRKLILTVGVPAPDIAWLRDVAGLTTFRFVPVGRFAEADNPELCRPRRFIRETLAEIRRRGLRPAGIVGFDDYPASLLALAIGERLGLPGPSLRAALCCSHKAWSRVMQRAAAPQAVPAFQLIDPRRRYRQSDLRLQFPFWLKPVKSSMSFLGFRIDDFASFERAVALSRAGLRQYVAAFNELLTFASPPPSLAGVGGDWLIAESMLRGRQCTFEGAMQGGRMTMLGIVDSIRLPNRVSFTRFEYPSRLPRATQWAMAGIADAVMRRIGFDDGLFNVEFFVAGNDASPKIIEINPRFSPQFTDLYHKVDGAYGHRRVVEAAAGMPVINAHRAGRYGVAASFVLRTKQDSIVRRVPTPREIASLQRLYPDSYVEMTAGTGDRLSQRVQDMYSYRYALVHLGAADRVQLQRRFRRAKRLLRFDLAPIEASPGRSGSRPSDRTGGRRPS